MLDSFTVGHMTESWASTLLYTDFFNEKCARQIKSRASEMFSVALWTIFVYFMISPANFQTFSSNVSLATVIRSKAK
jgi:hypothetical protein